MADPGWLAADWPAPANVRAGTTTRAGGISRGPWASLNLGDRAGDDPKAVAANRAKLHAYLELPACPRWLHQVHGTTVARLGAPTGGDDVPATVAGSAPVADAAAAVTANAVCAVLTADCLPVLLCDTAGTRVAAAHAGWRGLAAGVLEATVAAMDCAPGALLAWLGPAIGPAAFEVGDEVRAAFVRRDAALEAAFAPAAQPDKWFGDLYAIARAKLAAVGVAAVYGGGRCTGSEPEHFYSYRRDGATGRMASLIWLDY